jgi:hypothetical protein
VIQAAPGSALLQEPPLILKTKKTMLEAAGSGMKLGVSPFFTPGRTNKEGIPADDFRNMFSWKSQLMFLQRQWISWVQP